MNIQRLRLTHARLKKFLIVITLFQAFIVFAISLGVLSQSFSWILLAVLALGIVVLEPFQALLLVVLSIPWYIVLPIPFSDSFPTWRPLFLLLGASFALEFLISYKWKVLRNILWSHRTLWERWFFIFVCLACLSLFTAHFPLHGLKQIIYILNIALIYFVAVGSVRHFLQWRQLLYTSAFSAAILVFLGYVQFIASFFAGWYIFWQYWAVRVSDTYYGHALSLTLSYSNSWFSYTGGEQEWRMFGVLPDSHAFAMVAVFFIGFALPLTSLYEKYRTYYHDRSGALSNRKRLLLWYIIRFSGLAVILSGTRGVWVGMLVPLSVAVVGWWKGVARTAMKKITLACLLILLFFALTPAFNLLFRTLRVSHLEENFLKRARSIYDLGEESNAGRLLIWRQSLLYSLRHPLGVGAGNFIVSVVGDIPAGATFEQIAGQKNIRYNLPQKFITAHSLYLHVLVELGVAGIIVLCGLFGSFFQAVYRYLLKFRYENTVYTVAVASLSFTILWLLGYGVFDVTILNDRVLMYICIALALTTFMLKQRSNP